MIFSRNYRWVICALLFSATTINYLDRQILSLLKPTLDNTLHWSNAQFGYVNSAFQAAYAVGVLIFGWLIDRFGSKAGYTLAILAWSLAAMGHALVASVGGFMVARVFLGLGEAGNFPAAIKTVATWFSQRERALATSLFNSGANVGAIIAPATIPWIAFYAGWQASFIVAGVAGIIWVFFWLGFYRLPAPGEVVEFPDLDQAVAPLKTSPVQVEKVPWLSLLAYRQTWSFIVAKFLTDPIWWFFLIWLPDFFKKTRGLDLKNSWIHLVSIYSIVTVLSILGGWLTGYMATKGLTITQARKWGLFVAALCVAPIFYVTHSDIWVAVFLIGLAGAAHQAWSANLFSTVSDMFPQSAVASVTGLGTMAGSIGGILFPILTGVLLDHFQLLGDVTQGYTVLFGLCSFAYLVAFLLNHLLSPGFRPILEVPLPED